MDGDAGNDAADNGSADGMGGAVGGTGGNAGNGGSGPDGGFGDATIGASVGSYGGGPSMGFDADFTGTISAVPSRDAYDKDPFGIGISKEGITSGVVGLTTGVTVGLLDLTLDVVALSVTGVIGTIAGPTIAGMYLGTNPEAVSQTVDTLGQMGRDSGFMDGGL